MAKCHWLLELFVNTYKGRNTAEGISIRYTQTSLIHCHLDPHGWSVILMINGFQIYLSTLIFGKIFSVYAKMPKNFCTAAQTGGNIHSKCWGWVCYK